VRIPSARGPFTATVVDVLDGPRRPAESLARLAHEAVGASQDVLYDDDVQLGLTLLYELHYRGLDGVPDDWEWDPALLAARAVLERGFEQELRSRFERPELRTLRPDAVARTLFDLTADTGGPSPAGFVARSATVEQVREMCVLRSVYQLKEADPHTWALPRLHGRPKSALVEIQADEYGNGRPGRMHAELFAATLRSLGLDDTYGAYVEETPAVTLAGVNAMHLFGLHRRWRGALVGHLAAYEMTSSAPCKRYAAGLRRLGLPEEAAEFFDEHVQADAVHEQVAAHDLCGALAASEPRLAADILFGAATCLGLDALAASATLDAWTAGRTALRPRGTSRRAAQSTGVDRGDYPFPGRRCVEVRKFPSRAGVEP
jgi:hypothetical protein